MDKFHLLICKIHLIVILVYHGGRKKGRRQKGSPHGCQKGSPFFRHKRSHYINIEKQLVYFYYDKLVEIVCLSKYVIMYTQIIELKIIFHSFFFKNFLLYPLFKFSNININWKINILLLVVWFILFIIEKLYIFIENKTLFFSDFW